MHPLNKNSFGNATGSIKVHYNDGTGIHTGYIVKQPSATKWRVANASIAANAVTDSNTSVCKLVGNASPAAGQFTIYAYPVSGGVASNSAVYVKKIDGHHVSTSDGKKYIWTLADSLPTANGYVVLDQN
jgi:hypothetical protein